MRENQIIVGYCTVWDTPYESPLGVRVFQRSECSEALSNPRCKALLYHDHDEEIGSVANGGLLLKADDHGLLAFISCPFDDDGRDVFRMVQADQLSMSLLERSDVRETFYSAGRHINILHIDELEEVSLTDGPRNRATTAIAISSWKRHYLESHGFYVRDDMETLRRLARRRWSQPGDMATAQQAGHRLSLWRLARIARCNENASLAPLHLGCRPMTVDVVTGSPELLAADLALACGM